MAALERRTCVIFLRNWHQNPRSTSEVSVHSVPSSVTLPLRDVLKFIRACIFPLWCPCVGMLMHLCVKTRHHFTHSAAAHFLSDRAPFEMTPPPLPPPQQDIAQWHNRVMAVHVGAGRGQRSREELKKAGGGRGVIWSLTAQREGLCWLWPASYTNTILTHNPLSYALRETFFPVEGGQERAWHWSDKRDSRWRKEEGC